MKSDSIHLCLQNQNICEDNRNTLWDLLQYSLILLYIEFFLNNRLSNDDFMLKYQARIFNLYCLEKKSLSKYKPTHFAWPTSLYPTSNHQLISISSRFDKGTFRSKFYADHKYAFRIRSSILIQMLFRFFRHFCTNELLL